MPDTSPYAGWIITTVAGTGAAGYAGDGGPASAATLNNPFDVAFDAAGNLVFSDTYNHCIRRIDARSGAIETVAGCGEAGYRKGPAAVLVVSGPLQSNSGSSLSCPQNSGRKWQMEWRQPNRPRS
jgi:hypothetical protein